jgi:MFS family permease
MQKFLVNTVGLTKGESTLVSAASVFVFMVLQPVMGALSDRVGRRLVLSVVVQAHRSRRAVLLVRHRLRILLAAGVSLHA